MKFIVATFNLYTQMFNMSIYILHNYILFWSDQIYQIIKSFFLDVC